MKVLHIASGDLWAGAEVQLFTLAKALNSMPGVAVEVVLLNRGRLEEELRDAGIKASVIDETKLNGIKILFQLIGILREVKPDLVHTHRLKENILGSIAAFVAGNIPSLRTVHGAPEHAPSWRQLAKRIIYGIDSFCGRFLQQKIIAVSTDLAVILKNHFPSNKVDVIENGVDIAYVTNSGSRECQIDITKPIKIGFVGRLVSVKRADLFIRIAHELCSNYPDLNISFHIFGDGPLRHELELLNLELGNSQQIHFEGHSDNIYRQLSDIDILMMTSDHEGMPMILLEAMSLKIAIIARSVGGIPNMLDYGKSGILVQSDHVDDYTIEVMRLINSPEKYELIVQNARSRVEEKYSSLSNADRYRLAYLSLVKQ